LLETALTDWHDGVSGVALPDDIDHALREWKASTLNGKYENFTEVYQELLVILGIKQLDPDDPEHAVIMANLGRFNSLLTDYETSNMIGGRKRNWNRDLKGLCWYMNLYATSSYEEQEGDDVSGVNAIQLMTVHQAKGLEWSVVFIPSLVKRRFPSSMVGRRGHWLIPRDLFDADKYEGDVESERKLLYVALTRAKDVVVVSYFKEMNGNRVAASDFVADDLDTDKMVALDDTHPLPAQTVSTGGDPDEIQTYTAGEIITYGRCPYLYRFRHVWGYQPGLKERLGYGNTLHFCMRGASELIKQGYNPLTAVVASVNDNFYMPFINKTVSDKIKDAARKKLARFVNEHQEDMLRIKEVESRIEFPLSRATVVGRVDVILHDGGNLEIRDYKTSDRVVTQDEVELQIRLYTLGLTMLGEPVTRGSVAYLEDASITQVDVSREQIEKAQTMAEGYINGIISHDFKPRPDKHCGQCDYKKICRHVVC
jgi:DNA helicase-2/ATP-dependent DNA helicase PcrA